LAASAGCSAAVAADGCAASVPNLNPLVPNVNPEVGFVPKLPENVEPPSVAVVDVAVDTADEAERPKSGVCCVAGASVFGEVVVKKPGLAYAAGLLNAVGSVDDAGATALLVVAIDDSGPTALDVLADATVHTVHTSQMKTCSDLYLILVTASHMHKHTCISHDGKVRTSVVLMFYTGTRTVSLFR